MSDKSLQDDIEPMERRRSIRVDMEQAKLAISFNDEQNTAVAHEVTCIDFSKGGILFHFPSAIPLSTKVSATFQIKPASPMTFYGEVGRIDKLADGTCNIALHIPTT